MFKIFETFLILILICPFFVRAKEPKKPIHVGVYNNPPKIFLNDRKEPDGIFIDILKSVAESENVTFVYVPGTWEQLFNKLKTGEIDLLPDMAHSKERDSLFSRNRLPVLGSWLEVFTPQSSTIHAIADLAGKKIGLLRGSIQERYMQEVMKKEFAIEFEIIAFPEQEQNVQALRSGQVEAIVADRFFYFSTLYDDEFVSAGIIFRPTELYFATTKNAHPELRQLLDRNISLMRNDPKSIYYASLNKWFDKGNLQRFPTSILIAITCIGFGLLIVLVFVFVLRQQVDIRTRALVEKNKELRLAKEKAEESEHLKTVFLQNMSHEIRTPMNGILGFLEILKNPDLEPENREKSIDIITKSGQRLLNTINSIIELSKLEANLVKIQPAEVNLAAIMEFQFNFFQPAVQEKGLKLELSEQLRGPHARIISDKYIIDNILTNLINNAIKFTKSGKIEFGNFLDGENVVLYVKDTGVGIPPDRLDAIFDRFVQADLNITRAHEGSGLGLSIVKAYAEKLGGKIRVESEIGKGSTFYVSFAHKLPPTEPKSTSIESSEKQLMARNMTVLVAEDDDISFMFIDTLLSRTGIKIERAHNGEEAVDFMKNNPDIALIFMDIKMPKLDGIGAAKQIKAFNLNVPIVAQTAFTFKEDAEHGGKSLFDAVINKPISPKTLFEIVGKYTEGKN